MLYFRPTLELATELAMLNMNIFCFYLNTASESSSTIHFLHLIPRGAFLSLLSSSSFSLPCFLLMFGVQQRRVHCAHETHAWEIYQPVLRPKRSRSLALLSLSTMPTVSIQTMLWMGRILHSLRSTIIFTLQPWHPYSFHQQRSISFERNHYHVIT